jgi:acetyl esterase/lipase
MILKTIIIYFVILNAFLFPQEVKNNHIPRDTSYTLKSAFNKYKKNYPFIRSVHYDSLHGSLQYANVMYNSSGPRQLSLDIFSLIKDSDSVKPCVILVHGGGWSSGDRSLMYPLADYLAKNGYIAITIEYRLSPEAKYPAAVNDIKNAVTWVAKNGKDYNIDTSKITILGCSAGAQLAGLVGLTYTINKKNPHSNRISAIINIDGIMDFTSAEARRYEDDPSRKTTAAGRWFGGRYAEKPGLWHEASPVYYVNEYSPPILFINSSMPRFHAGRDEVIKKLDEFSIYHEVHTFDDAPHSFWLFDPWFERTGMYIVHFLKNLKSHTK